VLVEQAVDSGIEVGHPQPGEALQRHLVAPLRRRAAAGQRGGGVGQLDLGVLATGPAGQPFPHGLPVSHLVLLGQIAHRGCWRVEGDTAGVGLHQARQHLKKRGLAHSVGADDADAALRADGERDVVEDGPAPPVMGQVARHQRG